MDAHQPLKFRFSLVLLALAPVALAARARAEGTAFTRFDAPTPVQSPAASPRPVAPAARDEVAAPKEEAGTPAERAATHGFLLPFSQSPEIYSGNALVKAIAGYDTALKDYVARTSAEARILPFLALRVDFDHGPGMGPADRFGAGARLQLLRQAAHGLDGAVGLAYQPNDFRNEGQAVGSILLGRSFGRLHLSANALFGSDTEGDDQAGEVRFSALYRILRQLHGGFDSRFRFNASEDEKTVGTRAINWELQATPTASFTLGPIALLGQAGLSMLETTASFGTPQEKTLINSGLVAMVGAGGAF